MPVPHWLARRGGGGGECVPVPSPADPSWDVGGECVPVPLPDDPSWEVGGECVYLFPHQMTPRGT